MIITTRLTRSLLTILVILCCINLSYTAFSSQAQFSQSWSYLMNRYSAVTHCSQDQITKWTCKICDSSSKLVQISYIYNPIANVMGYIGYHSTKNIIIVSMRGTKDIKNWLENFTFKQVNYSACKGCLIHQGFYLDYLSVRAQVDSAIRELMRKYGSVKIVVTGSSLGGALATIAAIQLQQSIGNVVELHAFGCPRVGNANFAQYLTLKIPTIFRVIHNKDIVPHVPLLTQNYHHPAFEVLYDEEMKNYKLCDASGEDQSCSDMYYPNFSVSDHTRYWFKPVQEDVCTP